jgi:hypothetical protein
MSKTGDQASPQTIADMEARVSAMSALVKSLLTTLMLRGLLNRAEIAPLIADAEALMATGGAAGKAELDSVRADLPVYLREAMGPAPDPDDHDH